MIPEVYKQRKKKGERKCLIYIVVMSGLYQQFKRILSDEQYIGTYVMRKTVVKELGTKSVNQNEKDWIKIPNHHEAIIEKGNI